MRERHPGDPVDGVNFVSNFFFAFCGMLVALAVVVAWKGRKFFE